MLQGTSARILETRKTAPGLRLPDKWAVLIGGGSNHRIGLFDMVMIKDNHVTSAGGVVPAIQHAQVCIPLTSWPSLNHMQYVHLLLHSQAQLPTPPPSPNPSPPAFCMYFSSSGLNLHIAVHSCGLLCCLHDAVGTLLQAARQRSVPSNGHARDCINEVTVLLQDFVRRKHKNIPIEVETRTLDEVREVLQFLATDKHSLVKRLMLDNMTKLDSSAPGILRPVHADLCHESML